MQHNGKKRCIAQPSCEGLKILQGQIVKEQKIAFKKTCLPSKFMPGPEESRTPYPLLAKQMLYQMSYRP